MEECPPQVQRFPRQHIPSPSDFFSLIESKNLPAVFSDCIEDWKAYVKWDPARGGLDYLQERVGSCVVEAMLSKSAPVFYGDIRSHERVRLLFSTFIGYCKWRMEKEDGSATASSEGYPDFAPQEIYLAQVPIMNAEDRERVQLRTLEEDIGKPAFLGTKELASINLWMNNARARSSTHYDPHHNVLCVVAGRKQVVLWPPSASPLLYPMPIYGEASNHSSVALDNPDFSSYPRAECSMEYSQTIILYAGDALFIPEGWFHQVDSDDLTIAVNFWWQSNIMSNMLEHMDAYYLRRILRRLTDKELSLVFQKDGSPMVEKPNDQSCKLLSSGKSDHCPGKRNKESGGQDLHEKEQRHGVNLHELEPLSLHALQKLVSLVHDFVNISDQSQSSQSSSTNQSTVVKDKSDRFVTTNLFLPEDDPVAEIFLSLDSCTLQEVLLAMAHNFPRTLEALVLHLLSPVGAEVLTQKFDEMDKWATEEDRDKFYQDFYGAFDDQFAAMDAILNGKELFTFKAFRNVLDKYLGVNLDAPKPSLG